MLQYHALVVPQAHVKSVKSALESHGLLNKKIKIYSVDESAVQAQQKCYIISTTLQVSDGVTDKKTGDANVNVLHEFLKCHSNTLYLNGISCCTSRIPEGVDAMNGRLANNPLLSAIREAVHTTFPTLKGSELTTVLKGVPSSHCVYPPMLLLPRQVFASDLWSSHLAKATENLQADFFKVVAMHMNVTHLAINATIPLENDSANASTGITSENIIRSPTNFQPVIGDFGPPLPPYPQHVPSRQDFERALWVSARQNDITQVWAPRYTMFSAGNVTEKARILKLPSVIEAISEGKSDAGCTAIDLFAGIGYFAFSYVKAGFDKVLCWDLNPWSIEGLRRGAAANQWKTCSIPVSCHMTPEAGSQNSERLLPFDMIEADTRLVLFNESNELASTRISALRQAGLAPVRHVNCGMLPDAYSAAECAVEVVDPELGGWIHFHQVIGEGKSAEQEVQRTLSVLQEHTSKVATQRKTGQRPETRLVHLERVKSVAPRRWHVVLDVWVKP